MDAVTFHESDDRLELYSLNRLPDSDIESVEEHLLVCDSCRERLDQIGEFALAMRAALKTRPVTPFFPGWFSLSSFEWLTPQLGRTAAVAALVLAVGIYWTAGNARLTQVASLQLTALRGGAVPAVGTARELDLSFGGAAGASRAEIVDDSGGAVWKGSLTASGEQVRAKVMKTLSPGGYIARVYSGSGRLLHEYQFRIGR